MISEGGHLRWVATGGWSTHKGPQGLPPAIITWLLSIGPKTIFPCSLEPCDVMRYSTRFAWGGRPHRRLFWPTQTYIHKILQKHCLFQCFYMFFRQKHRNLHVFRLKVGPKHWFLHCFQCSGIQKPFKISLFTVFFHFCPFFPCRKPTKMTQNSVSMAS